MNEEQMNRLMTVIFAILAGLCGLGAAGLLITAAVQFSFAALFSAILLAGGSVASGWATTYYGHKVTGHPLVFTNEAEREVLTTKQRRELRRARGEVVMERAMIEVEHERQNIVHNQIEAAHDPDKPPHETQWTNAEAEIQRMLEQRRLDRDHDREQDRF